MTDTYSCGHKYPTLEGSQQNRTFEVPCPECYGLETLERMREKLEKRMNITNEQRDALKEARDRLKAVADESNDADYLETGDALDAMEKAYHAIDWLFTPVKPEPVEVGDVVVAKQGIRLHSGAGQYTYAVCVSADPFVLVSLQADMRWQTTVTPGDFRKYRDATAVELVRCAQRRDK